jgi:hypothetical protein
VYRCYNLVDQQALETLFNDQTLSAGLGGAVQVESS